MEENRENFQTEERNLQNKIDKMNSFKERTTGSKGHELFVKWLEDEIEAMGFMIHRKEYRFDRWELEHASLYLGEEEIEISSVYPYSGETSKNGLNSEVVLVNKRNLKKAKGKIALIEIDNTKTLPIPLIMDERGAFPKTTIVNKSDGDVVITSTLWTPDLKKLKEIGILGVIFIWKGISSEKAKDQYAPFTKGYADLPAIWVDESNGEKLKIAARKNQRARLIVAAIIEAQASTESFYIEIEGKKKQETIIINSHTDGVNVVEENGAIAMLSLIEQWKDKKPERNLIFAFVTGHFRLPVFKGSSQATSTWMADHPYLWDGKDGHKKAIAALTMEHLGAMEWKDTKMGYQSTGEIQTEYVYVNNDELMTIWDNAIKHRKVNRTVFLRGHNKFQFGESQPLFEKKIPVLGFIPMPDYLLTNSRHREMDKFNVSLMLEQINAFAIVLEQLDQVKANQIEKVYGYSFGWGRVRRES